MADAATRVLILGSLPGVVSLQRVQYYAHPQNQFWRLAGAVIGGELAALRYDLRLERLRAAGMGLWDVIRAAERAGSLDASIRNHEANALGEFAGTLPSLRAIAFNGQKAAAIGRLQLGASGIPCITLPSSSAAHAIGFERKLQAWLRLHEFL